MYTVSPQDRECFYLRLLLHNVRGPTSYNDLRRVDNTVHKSFEDACRARHLLIDDNQWEEAMKEACIISHPSKLRELFVIIVVHCYAANSLYLWETFKEEMSDDIRYNIEKEVQSHTVECSDEILNMCLLDIEKRLNCISNGKTMGDYGLPTPKKQGPYVCNDEYYQATNHDCSTLQQIIEYGDPKLNSEQQEVVYTIMKDIEQTVGNTYYLDAPGGTGTISTFHYFY